MSARSTIARTYRGELTALPFRNLAPSAADERLAALQWLLKETGFWFGAPESVRKFAEHAADCFKRGDHLACYEPTRDERGQ